MGPKRMSVKRAFLWLLLPLTILGFPGQAQTATKSDPLAEVDGVSITAGEVEKALAPALAALQEKLYDLKREQLEALIGERLLIREAAKRGLTVPALLNAEVTAKVGVVTEQEIESFYQANRERLEGDEATVRDRIRAYLQNQKLAAKRDAFLQSLRAQAKVVVHLKPPPVFRASVPVDGAPFKGPVKAPVTIVEFQDFHCSYCRQIQATLTELLARYGGMLKVVYRDFPIDSLHPQARKAHEAARCANEQGKFWAYHDLLYKNAPKASAEQLTDFAREAGLDIQAFQQCLGNAKYRAAVQKDIDDGLRLGVSGTPAFFVNGRLLPGAQPLEKFVTLIEDELARVAQRSPNPQ